MSIPHLPQHSGGGGDERWLVSYADMITLLTVLFIVLYSMANTDLAKFQALSESLKDGFGATAASASSITEVGTDSGNNPVYDLSGGGDSPLEMFAEHQIPIQIFQFYKSLTGESGNGKDGLVQKLEGMLGELAEKQGIGDAGVEISYNERGITISIYPSQILFDAGSANLKPASLPVIAEIAKSLKSVPNRIEVQGHTDSQPMSSALYPSNWELSASRAGAVLRQLEKNGVSSERLAAAGYAHTRPLADNDTAEGRSRNRRVEFLILREPERPRQMLENPLPKPEQAGQEGHAKAHSAPASPPEEERKGHGHGHGH